MSEITYTLIRSSRRTLSMEISNDGSLIIRAPHLVSRSRIDTFVAAKKTWIQKHQKNMVRHALTPIKKRFNEGEHFLFLGRTYPLTYTDKPLRSVKLDNSLTLHMRMQKEPAKYIEAWYKKEARTVMAERTAFWTNKTGLTCRAVKLSSAQKRWGSCNSRSEINLNWRLVMAPVDVIDYVVVHELVHTEVYNHTQEFWGQVSRILPDYKKQRQWLKDHRSEMMF